MFSPKNAAAGNSIYGPTRFLNNHALLCKGGEIVVLLKGWGLDVDWQTDEMLENQNADIGGVLRSIPEGFRIHQFLVKTDGVTMDKPPEYKDPVVAQTVNTRANYMLKTNRFSTVEVYFAIAFEPNTIRRKFKLTLDKLVLSRKKVAIDLEYVMNVARTFEHKTRGMLGTRILSKQEAFQVLRFLQCLDREKAAKEQLQYDNNVDFWLTSEFMRVSPEGIEIGSQPVHVMSLRGLPNVTWPVLLRDLLSVRGNFLVTSQFARRRNSGVSTLIARQQDHYVSTQWIRDPFSVIKLMMSRGRKDNVVADPEAQKRIRELGSTVEQLSDGNFMGDFSMTVAVWGQDRNRAKLAAVEIETVFTRSQASLIEETYWAPGAFADIMPGTVPKHDFRQRQHLLLMSQYVDLALFYTHDRGNPRNDHLGSEHLLTLRTIDDTAYNMSLHHGDLMGALVFGVPGAGKSVFTNLCIDHSMKYAPETLILDGLGGSYRTLVAKHGGNYFELDPEGHWPFTLNPCALPNSRPVRHHISMLVRLCLTSGGLRLNARRNQQVFDAVGKLMDRPPKLRRFSNLELPGDLEVYFRPWREGGQYDFVFDNERDTFSLSKLQAIDFSAMDAYPDILQPLLFHFFYLWNTVVYDAEKLRTLKQMFVDEGWKMITYPAARRYIQTAGRTWRKRNGGVVLVTQSMVELQNAKMLDLVNELCPMKVLLANPDADVREYGRIFHLNEKESQNYMSLRGKGDVMIKAGRKSKVLHVDLDPEALWTYASSPEENSQRDEAIKKHGLTQGLRVLAAGAA